MSVRVGVTIVGPPIFGVRLMVEDISYIYMIRVEISFKCVKIDPSCYEL